MALFSRKLDPFKAIRYIENVLNSGVSDYIDLLWRLWPFGRKCGDGVGNGGIS